MAYNQKGYSYSEYARELRTAETDRNAQFRLGLAYYFGDGVISKDKASALKFFLAASRQNHPSAKYNLSIWYKIGGGGLPVDEEKSSILLSEAANLGSSKAIMKLIDEACKIDDFETAIDWIRVRDNANKIQATVSLAKECYTRYEFTKALYLFEQVAPQDNYALSMAETLTHRMKLDEKNQNYLEMLIKRNPGRGYYVKGHHLLLSDSGNHLSDNNNKKLGFEFIEKSLVEEGYVAAHHTLGACYYYGKSIERDYLKAHKHLTLSHEDSPGNCSYLLGLIYKNGLLEGFEDTNKAIEIWKSGAENDSEACQWMLACELVYQDPEVAKEWLARSAKRMYLDAVEALILIYESEGLSVLDIQKSEKERICFDGITRKLPEVPGDLSQIIKPEKNKIAQAALEAVVEGASLASKVSILLESWRLYPF